MLQIEPELPVDQIKKRYRSLSILVHPDKNQDDKERAQLAFDVVNKAWKTLENEVTRKRCLDIYEEAKDRTDHMVGKTFHNFLVCFFLTKDSNFQISEKRKKLKKEGKTDEVIPEDDPEKYKHAKYVMVMKVSAFETFVCNRFTYSDFFTISYSPIWRDANNN